MILMYDTAARCQEMLDIRIKDICFNEKTPYLYLTGKGSKTRSVPMMDATYRHLLKYLEKFHPDYKKNTPPDVAGHGRGVYEKIRENGKAYLPGSAG